MLVSGFLILDLTYAPLESHLVPHFLAHETGDPDTGNITNSFRMKTVHDIENLDWSFSLPEFHGLQCLLTRITK